MLSNRPNTNGAYTAARRMTVVGVTLQPGDRLPIDSPLRGMPQRLKTLVSLRWLLPATAFEPKAAQPAAPTPAKRTAENTAKSVRPRLAHLKRNELVQLAVRNGLKGTGTKIDLQRRLSAAGLG